VNPTALPLAVLAQLATTLPLAGLIWTIQRVHYPLFAHVGARSFTEYHAAHVAQITPVVLPLMGVELLAAIACVRWPSPRVPPWFGAAMLSLVLLAWATTALLSVPSHNALAAGFDESIHARLVLGNWLRTLAWTARSALLLWAVRQG
jgi:hypothetical protein